jgi:PKD repeat protein
MKKLTTIIKFCFLVISFLSNAQSQTKNVLFLGNSYTASNNLPQMVANVASSAGDILIFDSNSPGGYTFMGHTTNATSLAKIAQGNWDFVVLQEQSQLPSFSDAQVENQVFPYAQQLNELIVEQNPCAETAFYMTWGRKNGDASNCANWPPVCTYIGMDDLLHLRYQMMAEQNQAIVSPVGAVWRNIRENFPSIELYTSDGSHPSIAGTYAAACTFYSILFRKDPTLLTFNAGLSDEVASNIRNSTKIVVFDNFLEWHIGEYDPRADFSYSITANAQVNFINLSENGVEYLWDFGDESTSTESNPVHVYNAIGDYTVRLTVNQCGLSSTFEQLITIAALSIDDYTKDTILVYPNPTTDKVVVKVSEEFIGVKYKIVDFFGKTLLAGTLDNAEGHINISMLAAGIYNLQFENQNNTFYKLIKK